MVANGPARILSEKQKQKIKIKQEQGGRLDINKYLIVLYNSRKYPYPLQGWSPEIPRGRGVLKAKILEAKYEA